MGIKEVLKVLVFLTCILIFQNTYSQVNQSALDAAVEKDYLVAGDDFVPIPWGKELPISWLKLPGTWMVRQPNQQSSNYFTFQVLNQNGANKMLYIQQIDPKTCKVIGAGVANQSDKKVIYATLRNIKTKDVYRVNLRNFSATSFNTTALPTYDGQVMLMSIAFINSYRFAHYPLSKVNFNTMATISCKDRLIK